MCLVTNRIYFKIESVLFTSFITKKFYIFFEMNKDVIKVGDYIVIQKQNYKKLYKYNKPNSATTVGRDTINLNGIENCNYFSYFKIISKDNKKSREYNVELTDEIVNMRNEIDIKTSGNDNRNIVDDGRSQKLSAADIEELKNDANSASDIVETLITNSKSFHNKTEFAQEKYLRKKEKKYFEFLQILKPNLRTIAEIMYKLEPTKIQCLRIDTLSQIVTATNIHCNGNHLLYDSGSNGLLAAAILSAIGQGTEGKLVHMHPGNMSQKQALLAMNFTEEQYNRCISVNVYSVIRQFYQGCDTNENSLNSSTDNTLKRKNTDSIEHISKVAKCDETQESPKSADNVSMTSIENTNQNKKPKWHFDNITAANILANGVDSLVIACKEDPKNIFDELSKFVKPGRPFAVYYTVAEPLQQLYVHLKGQCNVAALKLTSNWMRNYQVLPERTHPEVIMNGASGFLLSGYILK